MGGRAEATCSAGLRLSPATPLSAADQRRSSRELAQAGLEAMAAGVPIVTQNEWGWKEMITHGETGFLGSCDEELAHYAACLAYDERLRMRIIRAARDDLQNRLANPDQLGQQWLDLFQSL